MKYYLPAFFILLSFNLLAQETKKVTQEISLSNNKAVFDVLKSNPSVKNGLYSETNIYNKQLRLTGYYKNNEKDSIWTHYASGEKIIAQGSYKNDKKYGVWEYFNNDGELKSKYDFNSGKFIFFSKAITDLLKTNSIKNRIINGTDTLLAVLDRPIMYSDGDEKVMMTLTNNIKYPAKARESNITGKVVIAFTIDTNGRAINYRVKKSLGYGCDEEVIRCLQLLEDDWLPGMLNNHAVAVEYSCPLNFSLGNR